MTWCNSSSCDVDDLSTTVDCRNLASPVASDGIRRSSLIKTCPSCGHRIPCDEQSASAVIQELPAGVKFDPTDQELLEHLEGKTRPEESHKFHPLVDEFIPTIQGDNGICYTHPEKLPGVSRDGIVRHFFHRPSKAYTTGTRKRRKVHTDEHGGETRWHKTGKTRPVFAGGNLKGYKKILVLYTNYGKQRKPEKTHWVMHQYHLGSDEEEKEGELVVSKVFYQTQPRQCGMASTKHNAVLQTKLKAGISSSGTTATDHGNINNYYNSSFNIAYNQTTHFAMHAGGASFLP